jgi:hypothetical protein
VGEISDCDRDFGLLRPAVGSERTPINAALLNPCDLKTLTVDQFPTAILLPGAQQNQITDRNLQGARLANVDAFAIAAAEIPFPALSVTLQRSLSGPILVLTQLSGAFCVKYRSSQT